VTDKEVLETVAKYREALGTNPPVRIANKSWMPNFAIGGDRRMVTQHVMWMLGQIPEFVYAGKREKADRWLGWVQCALWALGFYSIGQARDHNRGYNLDEE
jgi:hypothetical protein